MVNLDDILYKVTRPARYVGGEWNSVVKDWETAQIRIALSFPDLYEVGMSNLGVRLTSRRRCEAGACLCTPLNP